MSGRRISATSGGLQLRTLPRSEYILATIKNRYSLIGWELLLLFVSLLVLRRAWLLLDEMKWARETAGLLALLLPGVGLCLFALRAIHSDK